MLSSGYSITHAKVTNEHRVIASGRITMGVSILSIKKYTIFLEKTVTVKSSYYSLSRSPTLIASLLKRNSWVLALQHVVQINDIHFEKNRIHNEY